MRYWQYTNYRSPLNPLWSHPDDFNLPPQVINAALVLYKSRGLLPAVVVFRTYDILMLRMVHEGKRTLDQYIRWMLVRPIFFSYYVSPAGPRVC